MFHDKVYFCDSCDGPGSSFVDQDSLDLVFSIIMCRKITNFSILNVCFNFVEIIN